MDSFKVSQLAFTVSSLVLGNSFTRNFEALSDGIKGFFGNVVGLRLFFSTTVDESTADAALAHETLRNFMSSLTIKGPTQEWCSSVQGRDLWQLLAHSGILAGNAGDVVHIADIASSEAAKTVAQEYLVPFALGHYLPRNFSEEDDLLGAMPVSMLKKSGSVSASLISSLGGNWRLDAGTATVTVYCYADIVYTRKPVSYVPSFFKAEDYAGDTFELDNGGRAVSVPYLAVFDDDYSTFTSPTEPRVENDGHVVQHLVSGDELNKRQSYSKDTTREQYADDGCLLFSPTDANDPGGWHTGRVIKITKAGAQQSGDSRYVYMCYQETKPTDLLSQLESQGFDPRKGQVREAVEDITTLAPMAPDGRPSRVLHKQFPAGVTVDPRNIGARARAFTINV